MEIVKVREDLGVRMYMVLDNDGREIAYCSQGQSEQNLTDAERIAAMWDALRGFTTEEIKAGLDLAAINLALKANKAMLAAETARADNAEKQRDELLEDANRYRWLRDESPQYKSPATSGTEVDGFGLKVVFQYSGTDARSLPLRFLSGAVLDSVTDAVIASVKGGE